MSKYKVSVVIGRFQPLHNNHIELIEFAKTLAPDTLVLVGSHNEPRSIKNPFTSGERARLISDSIKGVLTLMLQDYLYNNDHWTLKAKEVIRGACPGVDDSDIVLVGHHKDESSFYLELFPEFGFAEFEMKETDFETMGRECARKHLSSTLIREVWFGRKKGSHTERLAYLQVPQATKNLIYNSMSSPWYQQLRKQALAEQAYKQSWASAPFPPVFVATDNLVICKDQILLIERKSEFGNGMLAMPGGFLDTHETIRNGALRELKEETNIGVEDLDSFGAPVIFDKPDRSGRGRMITHVYPWKLRAEYFSDVDYRAGDDAGKIVILPIGHLEVNRECFFSDHFHIIFNILSAKGLI